MTHIYKVGQMLNLRSAPRQSNRPNGLCEVIACLPHDSGPVQYRVQSQGESNERVVEENDLSPSGVNKADETLIQSVFRIAVSKR